MFNTQFGSNEKIVDLVDQEVLKTFLMNYYKSDSPEDIIAAIQNDIKCVENLNELIENSSTPERQFFKNMFMIFPEVFSPEVTRKLKKIYSPKRI